MKDGDGREDVSSGRGLGPLRWQVWVRVRRAGSRSRAGLGWAGLGWEEYTTDLLEELPFYYVISETVNEQRAGVRRVARLCGRGCASDSELSAWGVGGGAFQKGGPGRPWAEAGAPGSGNDAQAVASCQGAWIDSELARPSFGYLTPSSYYTQPTMSSANPDSRPLPEGWITQYNDQCELLLHQPSLARPVHGTRLTPRPHGWLGTSHDCRREMEHLLTRAGWWFV